MLNVDTVHSLSRPSSAKNAKVQAPKALWRQSCKRVETSKGRVTEQG